MIGLMFTAAIATWPLWLIIFAVCVIYATLPKHNGER